MRTILFASTLLATLLLAAACSDDGSIETSEIVSVIPWPDEERAEYVLLDRDDLEQERGRGVITVTRQRNQFELHLRFEGDGDSDDIVVLVDAESLKPSSVRREISREAITVTGEYDPVEESVDIVLTDNDGDTRSVPLRLGENYYDNESSLFIWRSIRFEEGYSASYNSVQTNQGEIVRFEIEVVGKQEITVPAGTFDTWRVVVTFGDITQSAWYADTPGRELIQYDNSDTVFQLIAINGG